MYIFVWKYRIKAGLSSQNIAVTLHIHSNIKGLQHPCSRNPRNYILPTNSQACTIKNFKIPRRIPWRQTRRISRYYMRTRGVEPRSPAWEAKIITVRPSTLELLKIDWIIELFQNYQLSVIHYWLGCIFIFIDSFKPVFNVNFRYVITYISLLMKSYQSSPLPLFSTA